MRFGWVVIFFGNQLLVWVLRHVWEIHSKYLDSGEVSRRRGWKIYFELYSVVVLLSLSHWKPSDFKIANKTVYEEPLFRQ